MALMTRDQFLAGLRQVGHRVFIQGERIDDVVEHPVSRPSALAMAETYHQATQAGPNDLFIARSHLTGDTINRFTHVHQSTDDLVKKILMLRSLGRRTASCFQRCAGLDCLNTLHAVTYETDQAFGTRYHSRFVDFLGYVQRNDLVAAACMTDPKGDRSLSPSEQADKDLYLRIVGETDDGIVVRGAKMHITGATNSHELIAVPTRALKEEDRDYAVAFAVPAVT